MLPLADGQLLREAPREGSWLVDSWFTKFWKRRFHDYDYEEEEEEEQEREQEEEEEEEKDGKGTDASRGGGANNRFTPHSPTMCMANTLWIPLDVVIEEKLVRMRPEPQGIVFFAFGAHPHFQEILGKNIALQQKRMVHVETLQRLA